MALTRASTQHSRPLQREERKKNMVNVFFYYSLSFFQKTAGEGRERDREREDQKKRENEKVQHEKKSQFILPRAKKK